MPKISLSISHGLGTEEAKRRITSFVAQACQQVCGVSDMNESWNGNVGTYNFRAVGFAVRAKLDVEPASLKVEIDFPLAALPWKGKAEREILTQAGALLA
jgi:hypothetical protein